MDSVRDYGVAAPHGPNMTGEHVATQDVDMTRNEAEALCKAAVKYWTEHKAPLIALRDKLAKERAQRPRDPKGYTAIDLNPEYQARMKQLVARVAPGGKYEAAKIGEYVERFKKAVVTDPKATFVVTGQFVSGRMKLSGSTSDRKYHDDLINVLVAMKLYDIANDIRFPKDRK